MRIPTLAVMRKHLRHPYSIALLALALSASACDDGTAPQVGPELLSYGRLASWIWSPGGDEIIYTTGFLDGTAVSIRARHRETRADRLLVSAPAGPRVIDRNSLVLSPSGEHLWFCAVDTSTFAQANVYRVPIAGGAAQLMATNVDYDRSGRPFAVTTTGGRIAMRTNLSEILLLDVTTSERITITPPRGWWVGRLSWSPDGTRLLAASNALFSVLDVATLEWSSWDATSGDAAVNYLASTTFRWENGAPVAYAVRVENADAIATRYDILAQQQQELGQVHGYAPGTTQGGYSWSPDFREVAWSDSHCIDRIPFQGGVLCGGSEFAVRVTALETGVSRTIATLRTSDWPGVGTTAISPDGARTAYHVNGLYVYGM